MATRRSTIKSRMTPKPKVAPKPGWMGLNPPKSKGNLPRAIQEPLPPGVVAGPVSPNYPRGGGPKPTLSGGPTSATKPKSRKLMISARRRAR